MVQVFACHSCPLVRHTFDRLKLVSLAAATAGHLSNTGVKKQNTLYIESIACY